MLSALVRFALSQRLITLLLAGLLVAIGTSAMVKLPIDAYPDISPTQAKIIIKAPGMTPEEVETLITAPLEVELLGIPNQEILRSISKYALSSITVDFVEGTDIYWARQQVNERLSGVWDQLPAGISGGLSPMSTPLSEMFMFTIDNQNMSLEERRFLLDWTIRPALRTVPGVADVNALGGFVRTFQVIPQRSSMHKLGFTNADIEAALQANNKSNGAGRLEQGEEAIFVRVPGAVSSLTDLQNINVTNNKGNVIALRELASVSLGTLERYGVVNADAKGEAVQGLVVSLRGANARQVVKDLREKMTEIQPNLPAGTELNVFYDRSDLINSAVSTVAKALVEAVILVVVLLGLFLGNVRAAFTVALVLPLSALFTFILMNKLGMSANLMSLGGMVIGIGMLVDSSIVIVENIVSSLVHASGRQQTLPKLHLVYRAVGEVATPVTAGIIIIMIVFLPLLSLEGLEGKLFGPVTITIVLALLGSLMLSLTLIPVVASWLIKADSYEDPWLTRKLTAIYSKLLKNTLRNPKPIMVFAAALLAITITIYPFVGKTFMPTMDEGDLIIQVESIPTVNLETSSRIVHLLQEKIIELPEIERVVARAGSDELGLDPMSLNEVDVFMKLANKEKWQVKNKSELEDRLREVMSKFPGINYGFTQPIDMRVSEMLTGSRGDVAIKIFGDDLTQLNSYATEVERIVSSVQGSIDTVATINEGAQYLQIELNRQRLGQFGVDMDSMQARLRAEVEGIRAGTIIQGNARVPLMLRYTKPEGDGEAMLKQSLIELPDGRVIPLSVLADVRRVEGPVSVSRESGQRFAVVRTNVEGRDLVGFVEEAKTKVAEELFLDEGYVLVWGGQFENQQRAASRLMLVIPIALALIAFILFLTFRSVKQTLLILSNIPFALTGGVIALWGAGEFLSVPASVGFIALLGVAVLNGVVMMSHFNQLAAKGLGLEVVVFEGAVRRLRPVMMTASICAIGLVPLLLATGPGSEIQRPLAIVVIGGLVTSTLLTLFLLPLTYKYFHRAT